MKPLPKSLPVTNIYSTTGAIRAEYRRQLDMIVDQTSLRNWAANVEAEEESDAFTATEKEGLLMLGRIKWKECGP